MTKVWRVVINGRVYHDRDRTDGVVSSQMWTAVKRAMMAHFIQFPKQRYSHVEIEVECLGAAK